MDHNFHKDYLDLNIFRGLGEDPVYHPPHLIDRPRVWPLDRWVDAPRDLGFDDFPSCHWKGIRLLKEPATQVAYHNLLWELRPRTIIELGVYSGGSLVWFRDLTRLMGIDCQVIGLDNKLARCQIPDLEMENIVLQKGDCNVLESLEPLLAIAKHPLIVIDDAHCNTFNVMGWAVDQLLEHGDYFIIEDMIPYWNRYSPKLLAEYLGTFHDVLKMDLVYANSCSQLDRGVFCRSVEEKQRSHLQGNS